jgi:predicted nucleic acid-binding protein
VKTAVDSSVLVAIYKGESTGADWLALLQRQRQAGRLVACEVVVAETSAVFPEPREVLEFLRDLNVEYDPIKVESVVLAGTIFKAYRRKGGPREHLIPDFLIGAHATTQSNQLAAADRGYLRSYFPMLKVISLQ